MRLLDPRGRGAPVEFVVPAPRLARLEGRTMGLLDNGKPNADRFLTFVGQCLQEQHGVIRTVLATKPSLSRPAPAEIVDRLAAETDFVVTAIGE